jgi:hypothetical protein
MACSKSKTKLIYILKFNRLLNFKNILIVCETSGCQSDECEDSCLLGRCALSFGRYLWTFRRRFRVLMAKSKKVAVFSSPGWRQWVSLKRRSICTRMHIAGSWKTVRHIHFTLCLQHTYSFSTNPTNLMH